jgi:transposase
MDFYDDIKSICELEINIAVVLWRQHKTGIAFRFPHKHNTIFLFLFRNCNKMNTSSENERRVAYTHLLECLPAHHPGKEYSEDAKLMGLHCVAQLVVGDHDHRPLSIHNAYNRTQSLLHVDHKTLRSWEGEWEQHGKFIEHPRGGDVGLGFQVKLSPSQMGHLRIWILQNLPHKKGEPRLKAKHVRKHIKETYGVKYSHTQIITLMHEMGFHWGTVDPKDIDMLVHEREDVVKYRQFFLEQVAKVERSGEYVVVWGDATDIHVYEQEKKGWIYGVERQYPSHVGKGETFGLHHWVTQYGLLECEQSTARYMWSVDKDGTMDAKRFEQVCEVAVTTFEVMFPKKKGLFIYDNAGYASKHEFNISKSNKEQLVEWCENHGVDSTGIVKELKARIIQHPSYKHRPTLASYIFTAHGHRLLRLPAAHPEMNMEELVWLKLKRYLERHCDEDKAMLSQRVEEAYSHITPEKSLEYFERVHGFMEKYWFEFFSREWGKRVITKKRKK